MRPHRLLGVGAFLAVLVLAALSVGFAATPSRGASASRIVFVSDRDAYQPGEIYSLGHGRPPRNITHNRSTDIGLAVSPVGDTIAFMSNRSGRFRIYLARSDGSDLRVVNDLTTSRYPSGATPERIVFSRDGRWLFADLQTPSTASTISSNDSESGTFVIDVAHRTARRVLPDLPCLHLSPSPDGLSIACFTDFKSVTVYDLAGAVRFAFNSDLPPVWSRLGLLAGSVDTWNPRVSTSIMSTSGRIIARFRGSICGWSPDGRLIAFERRGVIRIGDPRHLAGAKIIRGITGCQGFLPDGDHLEATDDSGRRVVVPLGSGKPVRSPAYTAARLGPEPSQDIWSPKQQVAFMTPSGGEMPTTVAIRDLQGRGGVVGRFPFTVLAENLQWTPDSRSVLVDTTWRVGATLYTVPAGGGAARRVTSDVDALAAPAWSHDGKRITYVDAPLCVDGRSGCPPSMIMTARGDGTDSQVALVYGAWLGGPTFSPDAARIAFVRAEGLACSLRTVTAVRGVQTDLGPSPSCSPPAWSPDGSSIADIVLDEMRGTLAVRLVEPTTGQTLETIPAAVPWSGIRDFSLGWSPDGTRIAIAGKGGIYVLPVAPLATAQLAISIPGAAHPSFSPDGSQIAFDAPVAPKGNQAEATSQTSVMVANSDGSDAHILSTVPLTQSGHPAWQPLP